MNNQDKRLGDLYIDGDNMLDVSLTQRLLENMPEYKGQAPQDNPSKLTKAGGESSLKSAIEKAITAQQENPASYLSRMG